MIERFDWSATETEFRIQKSKYHRYSSFVCCLFTLIFWLVILGGVIFSNNLKPNDFVTIFFASAFGLIMFFVTKSSFKIAVNDIDYVIKKKGEKIFINNEKYCLSKITEILLLRQKLYTPKCFSCISINFDDKEKVLVRGIRYLDAYSIAAVLSSILKVEIVEAQYSFFSEYSL
jgi:hypothetical protein